jgi:predicted NAD/FAD-binding protein
VTKHTQLNPKSLAPNTKPASTSMGSAISITFDMNKLQGIPFPGETGSPGRVLVTMNPIRFPRNPQRSQVYYHPLLTSESILMSPHLDRINGAGNISFAGAWMGFGFHEDGFAAGAHVARWLIQGRENTAPLDLVARVRNNRRRKLRGLRLVLRLGVSALHKLLFKDKIAL